MVTFSTLCKIGSIWSSEKPSEFDEWYLYAYINKNQLVTKCKEAFFDAKSDTKIDFGDEFIVLTYLLKDKQ